MREIKFRAWDGEKMYSEALVIADGKAYRNYRDFEDDFPTCDKLMQYTGLKDKNDVEIYEGDVVFIKGEDNKGTVVWDLEELEYGLDMENVQVKLGCFYGRDLEVIGNIHDNPELLGSTP